MFSKVTDRGVSPVIGVILLVALTVSLVALVSVFVLDIGDDVSETADATVDIDEGDDEITGTIIRNENVDDIYFQSVDATDGNELLAGDEEDSSAGETITLSESEDDWDSDEPVQVIAVVDGDEQVLLTANE